MPDVPTIDDLPAQSLTCFVIMPIADVDGYSAGHFARVYDHLLAPAAKVAGFEPELASRVQSTNMIVLDILRRLLAADIVLCDLSARNPNVLYELGLRQAFAKPVTLVKDRRSLRIFDVQGIRDIEYDESLRIDTAQSAIAEIATTLRNTHEQSHRGQDVNSIVQLLGIERARVPERSLVSPDTQLLLNALSEVGDRVAALERRPAARPASWQAAFLADDISPGSLSDHPVTVSPAEVAQGMSASGQMVSRRSESEILAAVQQVTKATGMNAPEAKARLAREARRLHGRPLSDLTLAMLKQVTDFAVRSLKTEVK